jgi:MFS family permease
LLAVASQTSFVIANTLMAHYARWIDFLGGDLRQIGNIMGAGAALGLVLRPWMAQWINRIGALKMWGVGYLVFSCGSLANLAIYEISPALYLVRASIVLGAAIVFASSLTYAAQTAPEDRRTEAIGILGVGGFLGMLVGPLLGDFFLHDALRDRADFAWLFGVAAVANGLPAILLLLMRPPSHTNQPTSMRLSEFFATVRRYWPGTILLVDLAFGLCMTAPFVFVASFIDGMPLEIPGLSVIGLFFWCYAGLAIFVRVAFRQLPDRIGPRRVLITGMLIMSLGMFSFGLVSAAHPWLIIVPALLTGSGHSLMFHTMTSLTIERFPTAVRGTASALALMMLDIGTFAGAPILGMIGSSFGFAALFATIGGCVLVAATVYALSAQSSNSWLVTWRKPRIDGGYHETR